MTLAPSGTEAATEGSRSLSVVDLMTQVPVAELCFLRPAADARTTAVREALLGIYLRQLPVAVAANIVCAALVLVSMYGHRAWPEVLLWFEFSLLLNLATMRFANRCNISARSWGPRARGLALAGCGILPAILSMAPLAYWFPDAEVRQQLVILQAGFGMMCSGALLLSVLPLAAIGVLLIYAVGVAVIGVRMDDWPLVILSAALSGALGCGALWSARQLVTQLRSRFELQEQASIIALLRDFGTSGSDWLWELDASLRLRRLGGRLPLAYGPRLKRLIGKSAFRLLDPTGKLRASNRALKEVAHYLACRIPFHDLAVLNSDGSRWWSISGKPVLDAAGELIGWQGVGSDVTLSRLEGKGSFGRARFDPLTGLGNRLFLVEQLEQSLLHWRRRGRSVSLLLIDLDRFKLVNDTLGHGAGDALLAQVANRLSKTIGDGGCAVRMGGDEFAVVEATADRDALAALSHRLVSELGRPFRLAGRDVNIGATIGIAIGGVHGDSPDDLINNADLALFAAKDMKRGSFQFFDATMAANARLIREVETHVRAAVRDGGFTLAYQNIVDARTLKTVAREALLRWSDDALSHISPALCIRVLEDTGLITLLGEQILDWACQEAKTWSDDARVAVNLSVGQFGTGRLVDIVQTALTKSGLPPGRLELEVTESAFMREDEVTAQELGQLHDMGVELALDDFGKGYSSFGYLQRTHFDKIKIDQSFVQGAAAGQRHSIAIVRGIIALARELGMETTAEGVETGQQMELMQRLGCTQLQGFAFGPPRIAVSRSVTGLVA